MSGWFVYLLECSDGSLYCGATNDPWRRFLVHERGKGARYTRARRPLRLVFAQETATKGEALSLEQRMKRLPTAVKRMLALDVTRSSCTAPRAKNAARSVAK